MSKLSKRKEREEDDADRDLHTDFDSETSSITQDNDSWTMLSESDYIIPTTINNYEGLKVWFHESIGQKDKYLHLHKKKDNFVYVLCSLSGTYS